MTRCLNDRNLFLMNEGDGDKEQHSHLESCPSCAQRYHRITADLQFIRNTLQKAPASIRLAPFRMPILYRSLPIAVALLFGIVLVWGESRLLNPISPSSTELNFNRDLTQFLDQVSDALFTNPNDRDARAISPDPDIDSVQAALGQDCSSECRELFASLVQERSR
jgi:hypothetical protein